MAVVLTLSDCVHRHTESLAQLLSACGLLPSRAREPSLCRHMEAETHEVSCRSCALDGLLVCLQNTPPFLFFTAACYRRKPNTWPGRPAHGHNSQC